MQRSSSSNGATLQDVAQAAGVSKTTAASILRNDRGFQAAAGTRARVLDTAATLGYRRNALAAALSSGRTHTVGILLPPLHTNAPSGLSHTFGQDVFVAVFDAASRVGLRVMPTCSALPAFPDRPLVPRDLLDGRVDGLILVSLRDRNFVEQIYASGIACVEMSSGFGNRLVHPDNHGGAAAAVNHLVERGHRRIAHWPGGIAGNHASEQRLRGFLDASARHGLRPEDVLIVKSADAVAERLRRPLRERPTAIFAFNDYQAFMTLDIARSLGLRVPADLSLVGFDDSILAQAARPMLTTVYNPLREQAEAAINVLQALWRGETDLPIPPAVPTRLVVRESTAAAPVPAPTPHPLDEEK